MVFAKYSQHFSILLEITDGWGLQHGNDECALDCMNSNSK